MKSGKLLPAIAILAGLVFGIGLLGFWGLTAQSPRSLLSQGGQSVPTMAQFVPRQSPMMVSLLARPDRLWRLRQLFAPPRDRFRTRQEWQALTNTLQTWSGLDYATDLQPWLGDEVVVAVTTPDLDHDDRNGQQPGYLAILSSRDGTKARETLHLFWQQRAIAGSGLVFEPYAGVTLIYERPQAPSPKAEQQLRSQPPRATVASAVIGDRYVLLANDPQVLRQAMTAVQAPDVSLARDRAYRTLIKTLPKNRVGWAYANFETALPWLGIRATPDATALAGAGRSAQRVFFSFRLTPKGLIADTAIAAAPGTEFSTDFKASRSPDLLQWLPATTALAATGRDLAHTIHALNHTIGGYTPVASAVQHIVDRLALPADVPTESLWQWVQEDYAVGLLAGQTSDWLLIAHTPESDRLKTLDALAQSQGLGVGQLDLGAQRATAWTRLSLSPRTSLTAPPQLRTEVVAVHATIAPDTTVFATSLSAIEQVLRSPTATPLTQSTQFVAAQTISDPSSSWLYVDWPQIKPRLLSQLPWLKALDQIGRPLTHHLGPVIIHAQPAADPTLQQGVVAIHLIGEAS